MQQEVKSPLSLAQEAELLKRKEKELTEQLEEVKSQLSEMAQEIRAAGPQMWVADGIRYRVIATARKTFEFDEAKFRQKEPEVYARCQRITVDEGRLKHEIASGTAKHWESYASYNQGRPYVLVNREEID